MSNKPKSVCRRCARICTGEENRPGCAKLKWRKGRGWWKWEDAKMLLEEICSWGIFMLLRISKGLYLDIPDSSDTVRPVFYIWGNSLLCVDSITLLLLPGSETRTSWTLRNPYKFWCLHHLSKGFGWIYNNFSYDIKFSALLAFCFTSLLISSFICMLFFLKKWLTFIHTYIGKRSVGSSKVIKYLIFIRSNGRVETPSLVTMLKKASKFWTEDYFLRYFCTPATDRKPYSSKSWVKMIIGRSNVFQVG